MPKAKKNITDYCTEAWDRNGLVDRERRQSFHLYAQSLARRAGELPHALRELNAAYSEVDIESTSGALHSGDLLRYRCATFWAMAYSVFDILANAANVVHQVAADERSVSFKTIVLPTWQGAPDLVNAVSEVKKRRYFKRLDMLRNCALHRRSVYLTEQVTNIEVAYHGFDSTEKPILRQWRICKDPAVLDPNADQTVELFAECQMIERSVQTDLVHLIKKV